MNSSTRNIAFCVNDVYVPYITVTIKSIAENNRYGKVSIHILTDSMTSKNRERLKETVEGYDNMLLHVYEVDDTLLRDLYAGNFTIYTWYRILIPMVLPTTIDRVLYLDADTLVTADLGELFMIDMNGKAIAASIDIQSWFGNPFLRCGYDSSKHYVCAGVLMMNIDYWRKYNLADKMIEWARQQQNYIKNPDQDTINYICQDVKIVLPLRYGFMHCFCEYDMFYKSPLREQLEQCIDNPVIIHYCGCVPWGREYHKHVMHHEWEKYNRMLRQPIKRTYQAKGWMKLKIICWDLQHLYQGRRQLTIDEIKKRLQNSNTLCKNQ